MIAGTLTREIGVDDGTISLLDRVIPRQLREEFEQRYWRPIELAATLERFADDPEFYRDPHGHVALFADHGIVHVRDVASRLAAMAEALNGALLPERSPERLGLVTGVGVLTAYLHDIGMVSATPQGRRAHPQFAAREPFRARFDDLAAAIWAADVGGIRRRIAEVGRAHPFPVADQVVLREILAMAMAHSKTAVPMAAINNRHELQARLRRAVFDPHPMDDGADNGPTDAARWYGGAIGASFDWLTATSTAHRTLADDVIDAIRLLRAADALRQRGTTLRTSAGYEIFVDQRTGMAIYGLRTADRVRSFYLLVSGDIAAGEANLRAAELSADGRLTFTFHQGDFEDEHADRAAARAAARVIADIWADVVPSFEGTDTALDMAAPSIASSDLSVVLLASRSMRQFVGRVAEELERSHPRCARGLQLADEPTAQLDEDREWDARGVPVEPDSAVASSRSYGGWVGTAARRLPSSLTKASRVTVQRRPRASRMSWLVPENVSAFRSKTRLVPPGDVTTTSRYPPMSMLKTGSRRRRSTAMARGGVLGSGPPVLTARTSALFFRRVSDTGTSNMIRSVAKYSRYAAPSA